MKNNTGTITLEFLYIPYTEGVRTVHIGVFPPRGRYFRHPMQRREDGIFVVELAVEPGEIYYHYFIDNDFSTPRCNKVEQLVSEQDTLQRSFIGIGASHFGAIEFNAGLPFVFSPGPGRYTLRAITHYSRLQMLILELPGGKQRPFTPLYRYRNKTYWQACFSESREEIPTSFAIQLRKENRGFYLHNKLDSLQFSQSLNRDCFFHFPTRAGAQEENPLISPSSVGYQVFPDRFWRSIPVVPARHLNPSSLSHWGDIPREHSYFGGNIRGIIDKLPYLKELEIDFIYLNPVFAASSSHRYDIVDYYQLDPLLGDSEDFLQLVRQGHRQGIKIILDIPLNHCGMDFFAFKDVLHRQQESSYCHWFHIHRFPVTVHNQGYDYNYDSWYGYRHMPEFNLYNPQVQNYLIDALIYWINHFDIDGIRLDTFSALPEDFVEKLTPALRTAKPGLFIIGESWNTTTASLIHGNLVNGITNYSFYWKVIVPLFEKKPFQLDRVADAIMDIFYHLPTEPGCYCWNFLGNHDLPRLVSIMQDQRYYKLAVTLVYTMPGIPVIYYGEEIGLEGGNDPDNRRCMDWDGLKKQEEQVVFYKTMNKVRKKYAAIFREPYISIPYLDPEHQVIVIRRFTLTESLAIIFNFGDKPLELTLAVITNKPEIKFTDITANRTGVSRCCVKALDVHMVHYYEKT